MPPFGMVNKNIRIMSEQIGEWIFEAKWARTKLTGTRHFTGKPTLRDSQGIEEDIEQMLGYRPEGLTVVWRQAAFCYQP